MNRTSRTIALTASESLCMRVITTDECRTKKVEQLYLRVKKRPARQHCNNISQSEGTCLSISMRLCRPRLSSEINEAGFATEPHSWKRSLCLVLTLDISVKQCNVAEAGINDLQPSKMQTRTQKRTQT